MRVTLRPYQEEALAKIAAAEQRGVRKQMLHAATGTGKGLAVGTPVLCGDGGWRLVEDLRAGDSVIGSDGRATRVVAVFHRGVQPRWAVEFDDRHVVVVDSDHLWAVATDSDLSRGRSWRTMSTEAIAAAGVAMPAGRLRWRVPVVAPIEPAGPSPVLPVDPYILGVLLADGALSLPGVRFTPGDAAIAAEVKDRLPGGMTLSAFTAPGRATGYRIVKASVAGRANPVRAALAGLGVLGCRAADKFIPPVYLRASEADRRGLLAGLMDCDGWAGSMVEYTTVSDRLAEDVVALVRSLGGVVRVRRRQRPGYTYNGEPRIGQPAWDISVRLGQCPFLLQRKADAWRAVPRAAPTRKIRSVVPVERGETVCIKVAAPDGLFVVGGYVVTHNTVVFSALAERRGDRALILAHRDELIGQAAAKVQEVWPEASIGVVKAEVNEVHAHVVVASVQTLSRDRRLRSLIDAWEEPTLGGSCSPFGLVVVDECHHATAVTYRKVLDALRAGEPGGPLLLGVTATPDRGDGQGLSDVFDEIVASYDIEWGIKAGYLCDLRGIRVALDGLDLGGVRTSRGDYQAGDLGDALAKAQVVPTAVRAWMEHARGRRTIVFTPTVALAADMAAAFECAGVNAAWVSGETPLEERRDTLARFADGRIDVVANCGVLCLDSETEILTDRGWCRYDAISMDHKVANWDQGIVAFYPPRDIVVRDRAPEEPMFTLDTPRRSIRVTGRHRMLYRTTRDGAWLKAPVDELAGRCVALPTTGWAAPSPVEVPAPIPVDARTVSSRSYMLRRRERYGRDESVIEARRRAEAKCAALAVAPPSKLSIDECRFIGFWLGDGTKSNLRSGGVEYVAAQSVAYPAIIEWFDGVVRRCGLDVRRRVRSSPIPHVRWSFARGTGGGSQQRRGVARLEPYLSKRGADMFWGLDDAQFEALLEGFWFADGDHGSGAAGWRRRGRIRGTQVELYDLLQAIGATRGWTMRVAVVQAPTNPAHTQQHTLSFHRRTAHRMGGTDPSWRIQREDAAWSPEIVWCVRTDTGNIITRRKGSVTVMGNTEGFDAPRTDCVLIARPTKSRALYTQQVGRGTRKHPDKADCIVLDVVGATAAHSLVTVPSLFGFGAVDPKVARRVARGELSVAEAIAEADRQLVAAGRLRAEDAELFARMRSTIAWAAADHGGRRAFVKSLGADRGGAQRGQVWIRQVTAGQDVYVAEHVRDGLVARTLLAGAPLELVQGVAEDFVRSVAPAALVQSDAPWRRRAPSDRQLEAARKWRLRVDPGWSSGELSDALDAHIAARTRHRRRG